MKKKQVQIPKARQLPSGKWFIQLRLGGKSISITEETERAAIAKAMATKEGFLEYTSTPTSDRTLSQAIDLWIQDNEFRLSPSTIRGYVTIRDNGFQSLMGMKCGKITDKTVASAINAECRRYSAKTVVNRWRFIAQVLEWATGQRFEPMLPQVVVEPSEFLDEEELKRMLYDLDEEDLYLLYVTALEMLRHKKGEA